MVYTCPARNRGKLQPYDYSSLYSYSCDLPRDSPSDGEIVKVLWNAGHACTQLLVLRLGTKLSTLLRLHSCHNLRNFLLLRWPTFKALWPCLSLSGAPVPNEAQSL